MRIAFSGQAWAQWPQPTHMLKKKVIGGSKGSS